MNKNVQRGLALVGAIAVSGSALATGPDMSGLTGAVDFTSVTTAVMAIAGFLAVVYVAVKGASIGLQMLKK